MPETTEQVDHKAEALTNAQFAKRNLGFAKGQIDSIRAKGTEGYEAEVALAYAGMAQAHSNLAIAEGQERVAEEIKAFRDLMAGSAT